MQISAIQSVSLTPKTHRLSRPDKYLSYNYQTVKIPQDILAIRQKPVQQKPYEINFTGVLFGENLIIKYLKSRASATSLKASRRLYLPLDKELAKISKFVDIIVPNGETIKALDINPEKSDKYLIYLHGFSQNITSNQPLYKSLALKGYGILAVDYGGYGKNPPSKHTSETNLVEDVSAAVKYLKEKWVKDIGLIGHSFGSYVAAKMSNMNKFAFQILVSPMISMEFWLKNVIKHPKKYKNEIRMIKYIPSFKNQYVKVFNITKYLETNQTPTYLVQSKSDKYIRTSKVNELAKIIPNLKDYVILPRGGHRMDEGKIGAITDIIENL